MFYPGPQGVPQARPGFFPPQLVQQRRWNGPGPMPQQIPGQPPYPGQPGIPPPQFARGQMPPQAAGRGMPPQGGVRPPPQQTGGPMQVPAARPPGRGGYKYTANARNAPQPAGLVGAPAAGGSAPSPPKATLNASTLAALTEPMQKQTLGEALFPQIVAFAGDSGLAGKVTGMLLEMDNAELLHLLENSDVLREKVGEATSVLEEHMKKAQA